MKLFKKKSKLLDASVTPLHATTSDNNDTSTELSASVSAPDPNIKYDPNTKTLDCTGKIFDIDAMIELGRVKLVGVEQLILDECNLQDVGCERLVAVLEKYPPQQLHTLSLRNNNIGVQGIKHLVWLIQCYDKLDTLRLSHNLIGDEGSKFLFQALDAMEVPPCLSKLSLGYNNISSAAIPIISHALSESMGLKQLSLDGNDQISDDSIAEVVNALVVNEERRLQMKKPGLKPRNNLPHWELLSLQMMGLGDNAATHLADLVQTRCCQRIQIQGNQITEQGAHCLLRANEQGYCMIEGYVQNNIQSEYMYSQFSQKNRIARALLAGKKPPPTGSAEQSSRHLLSSEHSSRTISSPGSLARRESGALDLSRSNSLLPSNMHSSLGDSPTTDEEGRPSLTQSDHVSTSSTSIRDFATSIRNLQIGSTRSSLSSNTYHGRSSRISPTSRRSSYDPAASERSLTRGDSGLPAPPLLASNSLGRRVSQHGRTSLQDSLHDSASFHTSSLHQSSSHHISGSLRNVPDQQYDDFDDDSSFHEEDPYQNGATESWQDQVHMPETTPATHQDYLTPSGRPPSPPPPPVNQPPTMNEAGPPIVETNASLIREARRESRRSRISMRREQQQQHSTSALAVPPQRGWNANDGPSLDDPDDPIDFLNSTSSPTRPPRPTARPDLQRAYQSMNTDFHTSSSLMNSNTSFAHRGHESMAAVSNTLDIPDDEALATLKSLFNNSEDFQAFLKENPM